MWAEEAYCYSCGLSYNIDTENTYTSAWDQHDHWQLVRLCPDCTKIYYLWEQTEYADLTFLEFYNKLCS